MYRTEQNGLYMLQHIWKQMKKNWRHNNNPVTINMFKAEIGGLKQIKHNN